MLIAKRLALLSSLVVFTVGCQNNGFKPIDFSEKQEFLHNKMVFEDSDISSPPIDRDQTIPTSNPNDRDSSADGVTNYRFGTDKEANEIIVKNPTSGRDSEMELINSLTQRTKSSSGEGVLIQPKESTPSVPVVTTTVPVVNQPAPVETPVPKTEERQPASQTPRTSQDRENDDTNKSIKVTYLCSNKHTNKKNGNLLLSRTIKLVVDDCEDSSASIRTNLINLKKLTTTKCQAQLDAFVASGSTDTDRIQLLMENGSNLVFGLDQGSGRKMELEVLYNINSNSGVEFNSSVDDKVQDTDLSNAGRCDRKASPLFVLMDDKLKSNLIFSSLTDGIMFDILGRKANHVKQQISWTNQSGMYFIALPDRTGSVKGIDQLFGDNTFGPDRKYSENGYEALRKWDDNNDGVINSDDSIYSKLKLWSDRDYNGSSNKSELVSLEQMGVETIDLNYDRNYSEEDRFGNKIMYKSVVRTFDQRLHLLFDVWFRYIPGQ